MLDLRLVDAAGRRTKPTVLVLFVAPAHDDEDARAINPPSELTDAVTTFVSESEHSGKAGELRSLPRPGERPSTVHLVGIGESAPADLRKAGAAIVKACGSDNTVAFAVVCIPEDLAADALRALAEGALLSAYRYTLASAAEKPTLRRLDFLVDQIDEVSLDAAKATAEATYFARDLVNTPSGIKDPAYFAAQAVKQAERHGIKAIVRDPAQLAKENFNGILAVGGGSSRGPRLVELRWWPRGASRHVVLVGKGITFDTGGISIKPGPGMQLMKKDMGGGAAVVGAILGAAMQKLPIKITVLVPMAENMPSGSAYRPGDVIRHYGGTTSEIFSTDAEGRIVLADALAYAVARLSPDVLIDLATLTGAQGMALGKRTAAVYSENDTLVKELSDAADAAGEKVWRMPLPADYLSDLDSDVADFNNAPSGGAGSVTAALFLREFTGDLRESWAHFDMSSPAWADSASDEITKGATGWGARTLLRWLESSV